MATSSKGTAVSLFGVDEIAVQLTILAVMYVACQVPAHIASQGW